MLMTAVHGMSTSSAATVITFIAVNRMNGHSWAETVPALLCNVRSVASMINTTSTSQCLWIARNVLYKFNIVLFLAVGLSINIFTLKS